MVDFEKIGRRIREQRKFGKRVSQERMALDLGMYQADISNLEKAKSGSGIGDLYKLDLIANYFNIPLATLIFGMEEDKMVHYYGNKIQLIEVVDPEFSEDMKAMLVSLSGFENIWKGTAVWKCGPYKIYITPEIQFTMGHGINGADRKRFNVSKFRLQKGHCYIMLEKEILGVMVFSKTAPKALVYRPSFEAFRDILRDSSWDAGDLLRILNPYWALYQFSPDEEKAQYQLPYLRRMDAIRALGQMPVVLIESVYIREDCRQHGLFRLCLDLIGSIFRKESIVWLNLEPTSGEEMFTTAGYYPNYTNSDLGQISMNAAIAEKMGFTVDSKIEKREIEQEDNDGFSSISIAEVRRSAYRFPKAVLEMIRHDSDLVALGRAKEELMKKDTVEGFEPVFRRTGKIGDHYVIAQHEIGYGSDRGKDHWLYAALKENEDKCRFGVSPFDPFEKGLDHKGQIAAFDGEPDEDNEYSFDLMSLMESLEETLRNRDHHCNCGDCVGLNDLEKYLGEELNEDLN